MDNMSKSMIRDEIDKLLSIYMNFIKLQNDKGLFDINKICENIFCDVLNTLYGLNLVNLNDIFESNFPAIDLGDEDSEICYQITSQNDVSKIKETIQKFKNKGLDNTYSEINIFILGEKKDYRKKFDDFVKILDFSDLSNDIQGVKQKEKLIEIYNILCDELGELKVITNTSSLLDNIEKNNVIYGNNYISYLDHINADEYLDELRDDINKFADILSDFDKKTREVILAILKKRIYEYDGVKYKEKIFFDFNNIASYLKDSNIVYQKLRELSYSGYLKEGDYQNTGLLAFWDTGYNYNILNAIMEFCEESKRDISKLILGLDFTILD